MWILLSRIQKAELHKAAPGEDELKAQKLVTQAWSFIVSVYR